MKLPDDPFIKELLPEFISTWTNDISEQLVKLSKDKNEDDLYRLAHTIKGSCYQFGLDDIAVLGIELMGYARANDWEKSIALEPILLKRFEEYRLFIENNNS